MCGLMNDAAPRLEFGRCQFTDVAEIEFSRMHLRARQRPARQKMFYGGMTFQAFAHLIYKA